ncbi:MAG: putative membrane protein YfcA [Gammaproteobacteria bacterium]|jgi:uncharacterized membrane protein YfcA
MTQLNAPIAHSARTGFVAGLLNGLIGIGGGIVIVPSMIARGATPQQAVGTSLTAVVILSSMAFVAHAWHSGVALGTERFLVVIVLGVIGALIGAWVLSKLSVKWMLLLFSALVFCLSLRLIVQGLGIAGLEPIWPGAVNVYGYASVGLASGILSGMFGVGGGALVVLSLAVLFGLSIHEGLPLALAVNVTNALVGAVRHTIAGRVRSNAVLTLIPAAIVGIAVGTTVALWLSADALRIVFGAFFCYMGMHIGRQGLRK